jgi:hypothetical protein
MDNKVRENTKVARFPTPQLGIGNAEKGEKRHYIFEGVDERSASDNPTNGCNNLASVASHFTVTVTNLVSLIENNTVPSLFEERWVVVELLIVANVNCRALLDKVTGDGCIRLIHKLPRNSRILIDFVDCAANLLKNVGPSVNHSERGDKEGEGLNIIDDCRGNLNGLAESHIITLEAATNCNIHSAILVRDRGAIDFFVKHPVDSLELMREVGKVFP